MYLPNTEAIPVIRADFSDDPAWETIVSRIETPKEDFPEAYISYVNDIRLADLDVAGLVSVFPRKYPMKYDHPVVFIADKTAMVSPEYPLLVINLNSWEETDPFRCTPGCVADIEANLSIANMDFFEYANIAKRNGIYRGF